MADSKYVFMKDNRLFINTSLGCKGNCSYCYLPTLGYSNDLNNYQTIKSNQILEMINNNFDITENTLITIGCYSECLDEYDKKETIDIIKHFLKKGNQIQLSTKKEILVDDFKEIVKLVKYYGQLIIFTSSTSITNQKNIEKNTTPIINRLNNFKTLNKLNIPSILYLKPVLRNITIKDIELYKKYIQEYNIENVVVGSIFTKEKSKEKSSFSNELFYNKNSDEDIIYKELSKVTNVYRRSTEVVKKYKRNMRENMKICIIRHGQTNWNVKGIIQGQQDIELNETGIKQAQEKIKEFNKYNFDLIISSTLKRARKTAEILNREKNIEIIYDDRLRERYFGDYEGTPANFNEDPIYNLKTNIKENNIETAQEIYNRVSGLLDEIKEKYKDKKVLLVTHGGTTRAIEAYFNGLNNDIMPPETIKNCEIREYEYNN